MKKRLVPATMRNPQDMTAYEFHNMVRSRVLGRSIKQHVLIKPNTEYLTESAKLGKAPTIRNRSDALDMNGRYGNTLGETGYIVIL
jgi:hypothetical protein